MSNHRLESDMLPVGRKMKTEIPVNMFGAAASLGAHPNSLLYTPIRRPGLAYRLWRNL